MRRYSKQKQIIKKSSNLSNSDNNKALDSKKKWKLLCKDKRTNKIIHDAWKKNSDHKSLKHSIIKFTKENL